MEPRLRTGVAEVLGVERHQRGPDVESERGGVTVGGELELTCEAVHERLKDRRDGGGVQQEEAVEVEEGAWPVMRGRCGCDGG